MTTHTREIASASAKIDGKWSERNDMRLIEEPALGLYCVADASGPTYGGYYAPFAIDPGLDAFVSALRREGQRGSPTAHMRSALLTAHATMKALSDQYETTFERLANTMEDRLEASRQAGDKVRPALWKDLQGKSFAHFGGQLTACWFPTPDRLVVGQVGTTRVYRRRGGQLCQLVADHSIASMAAREGESEDRVAELARNHPGVTGALLGLSADLDVTVEEFAAEPGDRFLLCTHWAYYPGDELVECLFAAGLAGPAMDAVLRSALGDNPQDAAVMRIDA